MTNTHKDNDKDVELFIQAEGNAEIVLVRTKGSQTVADWVSGLQMIPSDVRDPQHVLVTREGDDEPLPMDKTFAAVGINDRDRLHVGRCRKIVVTVNFQERSIKEAFPPSTTVGKVKKWADKEFKIDKLDATEHALQLCGTATRPDEDTHIGSLTKAPQCSVCFDLVPKKRVEGAA